MGGSHVKLAFQVLELCPGSSSCAQKWRKVGSLDIEHGLQDGMDDGCQAGFMGPSSRI